MAFGPRFSMTMMTPDVLNEGSGLSAEVGTAGPVDKSARLDRIGVVASAACAVHCLVAPLLMLALPVTGAIWSHWSVHWVLAVLVLPLACWVIYRGYRRHGRRLALVAAGLGSALIVAGLILPMVDTDWGVSASLPAWMGGGLAATAGGAEVEHAACADAACCPAVVPDAATGGWAVAFPAGGLATLLGSLFLTVAHGANLWSCRCFIRRPDRTDAPNVQTAGCCRG